MRFANISLAFRALRGNKLRAILTILIIAFGLMALVGILTATDAMKGSITSGFSRMGANSFTISAQRTFRSRGGDEQETDLKDIRYAEAVAFRDRYPLDIPVSISARFSAVSQWTSSEAETNPNIQVFGGDRAYLEVSGFELEEGRNFSPGELDRGAAVVLLGADAADLLFESPLDAIGQTVISGHHRFLVIGVLKPRGSSMVASDKMVIMPLSLARSKYNTSTTARYILSVAVPRPEMLDQAEGEAIGLLRSIRRLRIEAENDFVIMRSDAIANMLITNLEFVALAALLIGAITLFGAAISLMNIMLVSVVERTREVGVQKAIGAKNGTIRSQFLTEAVVICQTGGLVGILLGMLMGNVVSLVLGSPFVVPVGWMLLGVTLCMIVGMAAGIYPAVKASRLSPIEALRYE